MDEQEQPQVGPTDPVEDTSIDSTDDSDDDTSDDSTEDSTEDAGIPAQDTYTTQNGAVIHDDYLVQ